MPRIGKLRLRCLRLLHYTLHVKYNGRCQTCGHRGFYCHYEWAHWNRKEKNGAISDFLSKNKYQKIARELPLTRPLCHNCHAEETAFENGNLHAFM